MFKKFCAFGRFSKVVIFWRKSLAGENGEIQSGLAARADINRGT